MKVLIIDDNPSFLRIFKFYAEDFPYIDLIYAESGLKGLKILKNDKNNEISLILSDVRMPRMSGIEFLKVVKKKYPNKPVMLITGLDMNYLQNEDITDAIDVINKDVGFDGIFSKITNFLNSKFKSL